MFKIKKEKPAAVDPSQVMGSMGQVADAARQNLIGLIVGIAVVLMVAAAVGGFLWMRQEETRAAEDLLHEGMRVYTQGAPIPLAPRPEQLQKAADTFRKVQTQYPRSPAAAQAAYMLGNVLSDLKDWEAATKAYQDAIARFGDQKALIPLVYQRLAYAQLSQGKVDDAQKTFEAITKLPGAPNQAQALYELAKINEVLNRPEGAVAYYQQLVKEHPHSPYAEEASMRMKMLDVKKSPQPAPGAQTPIPPQGGLSPSQQTAPAPK
jgi:tetratricopeptide (TPR) repeat protein